MVGATSSGAAGDYLAALLQAERGSVRVEMDSPDSARASVAEQIRALSVARAEAVRRLYDAVLSGAEGEIIEAARIARRIGADGAEIPWDIICGIEARNEAMSAFAVALQSGGDEQIARAWSYARAVCPGVLSDDDERAGRQAFRRWGRLLRQQKRTTGQST